MIDLDTIADSFRRYGRTSACVKTADALLRLIEQNPSERKNVDTKMLALLEHFAGPDRYERAEQYAKDQAEKVVIETATAEPAEVPEGEEVPEAAKPAMEYARIWNEAMAEGLTIGREDYAAAREAIQGSGFGINWDADDHEWVAYDAEEDEADVLVYGEVV